MNVKFCRIGNIDFRIAKEKIFLTLPLDLSLRKGEGIFSVEVSGQIEVPIEIDYSINDSLHFETKTILGEYKWINGPIMEVGSLDIPIEKVADLVINYYKDDIINSLNKNIQESINNSILQILQAEKLSQLANDYMPEGIKVDVSIQEILMETPEINNKLLDVSALLKPTLSFFTDTIPHHTPSNKVSFKWIDKALSNTLGYVRLKLGYHFLLDMARNHFNGMEVGGKSLTIVNMGLEKNSDRFSLTMKIDSPIKGEIVADFKPKYNESSGELALDDFTSSIKPESFIYKLGTPILNKIINDRLDAIFPIQVNKILSDQILTLKSQTIVFNGFVVQPDVEFLFIDEMLFESQNIELKVRYENAILELSSEVKNI
jgi:hypothetical protein